MPGDDAVPPTLSDSEPTSPVDPAAGSPRPARDVSGTARWEFLEILAVVILAAESLRIVGSVIAGIIDAFAIPSGLHGQQRLIGGAIEQAANFSDGPGIVLLLLSLGLLWWRAESWTGRLRNSIATGPDHGGSPEEATQVHRLRALALWALLLFTIASAGALAYLVGNILVNTAGGVTTSLQWQAYADDLFSIAYLVIALAGMVASFRLYELCDVDIELIESAS